ncbi:U-box domain-containing protein 34 isoform X1 [Ricinus communis]|uniref:U-box domain-containing protein 34 isoform X1 n=1 Tax=Ricinus communis TaxID=3988 RepID=UPI00077280E7|nr:U-box domain-containing protein 34 isoform X1 [Ricinus communis]|eukprot:XP_015571799.1 U-box domain-containing protein 34 isoform X1 [Ricinus communis]
MTSVVVAVNGGDGVGGKGSRRAVRWAVENLLPIAHRFILVHVIPAITFIPTPSGDRIPIEELEDNVVSLYVQEVKVKLEEVFIPFKRLCKTQQMETLVLEDDNPATGILRYASQSGINCIVLGSWSPTCIIRKLKGPGIPATVLNCAPETCDVFVVSKNKIITTSTNFSSINETSSRCWMFKNRDHKKGYSNISKQVSGSELYSSAVESKVQKSFEASSLSELRFLDSQAPEHRDSSTNDSTDVDRAYQDMGDNLLTISTRRCESTASTISIQSYVQAELERLRLELQNTVSMYKRACEELVHTQSQVELLSSECVEEARRVNAALDREETLRKIAAEDKARYLQAKMEVENAKNLLAKEAYERQMAEHRAYIESSEKQKIADALFLNDKRYKRYTRDEIEAATDFFSESNVIGEGGYGKVYKCNLDHTPVAVKVLRSDAVNKKEEFLREVEVLSQLHHPHLVLLLGACPESGCLVYEYLENGSLDDCIFHRNEKPSLPWFIRFRIVFEVACALAFLHNSKPDPIVHRDLKPGNILLDRNYVSKIGDVGLAKLMTDIVPDNITEYKDSIIAGTLFYMDPEYQRTGTIRPKSDLYAFGVIILQLLTARRANGLVLAAENAIANGCLVDILDTSIMDWPLAEAEQLAQIALKCSNLKCRDRPDLDTEVLPVLRRLVEVGPASIKVERSNTYAPSYYFCPILQEIMDDPYIAADGFTYEHRAIKAWLGRHNVSPVTKLRLQHSMLTPNHTLRSAIQEWRSRVHFQVP